MPEKIWKPRVKKVGMENLESTETACGKGGRSQAKPGNDRHNLRQRSDPNPNDLSTSFYRPLLKFDLWVKKK
jgi:hypothetical protein